MSFYFLMIPVKFDDSCKISPVDFPCFHEAVFLMQYHILTVMK